MELKEWIKKARASKKLTQQQLGDVMGRTKANIGHWESGKHSPSYEQVLEIARIAGIPLPHDQEQKSNVETAPELRGAKEVPVVGEVQAGDDGYLEEMQYPVGYGDGTVEYWCRDPHAYALRVKGESMHPRYRHGEYIVVTPSIEAQTGNDVVVQFNDGRKMLKQLNWIRAGEVQLLSINNHFAPMTFSLEIITCIQRVAGSVGSDAFRKS